MNLPDYSDWVPAEYAVRGHDRAAFIDARCYQHAIKGGAMVEGLRLPATAMGI